MNHQPGEFWVGSNPVKREDLYAGPKTVLGMHPNGEAYIVAECNQHFQVSVTHARLFAASPKLLAACKAALGAFTNNNCIDWGDLERAIAEAEER